jgi:uncharacterized protein YoxC
MILQVLPEIDLNKAWDVNPNDGSAYGALIVLLVACVLGCVYLIKQERERNKELNDKLHNTLDIFTTKIAEVRESHHELKGVQDKVLYILEDVKEHLLKP